MPARCQNCPHRVGCEEASASRKGLVPLTRVTIELRPDNPPAGDDAALVQSEFQLYHRAVLRRPGATLDPKHVAVIIANANELGVEPGQLILATLLGHRSGGADRPFYGNMLVGANAIKHLTVFREECATRYGTFDTQLLSESLPPEHDIYGRLLASEELTAAWTINTTLNNRKMVSLYDQRECALDPWWLATESTYGIWLEAELAEGGRRVPELERHRKRVRLAASRAGFKAVIHARNGIARSVAMKMAAKLGLNPDHVLVKPVFNEPVKLWRALAQAAATNEAMSILYGV